MKSAANVEQTLKSRDEAEEGDGCVLPPQASSGVTRTSILKQNTWSFKPKGIFLVLNDYSSLTWCSSNTGHSLYIFQGKILTQDVKVTLN